MRSKFGVRQVAIYGSFAKGRQTKRSDIDLLVELEKPLGLGFVELAYHLEEALGRKVDLATFASLQRALQTAERQGAALDVKKTLMYV